MCLLEAMILLLVEKSVTCLDHNLLHCKSKKLYLCYFARLLTIPSLNQSNFLSIPSAAQVVLYLNVYSITTFSLGTDAKHCDLRRQTSMSFFLLLLTENKDPLDLYIKIEQMVMTSKQLVLMCLYLL